MKYLLLTLILLMSGSVLADTLPDSDSLFNRFTENLNTVSARFQQTKTIPGLTRQGQATGHLFFRRGSGFIWEQKTPAPIRFTATQTHWCRDTDKQPLSSLPHFKPIQRMIDSFLAGDLSELNDWFETDYQEKNQHWFLTLTPRRDELADWVALIDVTGTANSLAKIVFHQADGSVIMLQFTLDDQEVPNDMGC